MSALRTKRSITPSFYRCSYSRHGNIPSGVCPEFPSIPATLILLLRGLLLVPQFTFRAVSLLSGLLPRGSAGLCGALWGPRRLCPPAGPFDNVASFPCPRQGGRTRGCCLAPCGWVRSPTQCRRCRPGFEYARRRVFGRYSDRVPGPRRRRRRPRGVGAIWRGSASFRPFPPPRGWTRRKSRPGAQFKGKAHENIWAHPASL